MSVLRQREATVPPLGKAELDHVLNCYKELRARRPELAQGEIIVNVANELRLCETDRRRGTVLP